LVVDPSPTLVEPHAFEVACSLQKSWVSRAPVAGTYVAIAAEMFAIAASEALVGPIALRLSEALLDWAMVRAIRYAWNHAVTRRRAGQSGTAAPPPWKVRPGGRDPTSLIAAGDRGLPPAPR